MRAADMPDGVRAIVLGRDDMYGAWSPEVRLTASVARWVQYAPIEGDDDA
jgi:hypothetical protein